jgi:hypothetical protein
MADLIFRDFRQRQWNIVKKNFLNGMIDIDLEKPHRFKLNKVYRITYIYIPREHSKFFRISKHGSYIYYSFLQRINKEN